MFDFIKRTRDRIRRRKRNNPEVQPEIYEAEIVEEIPIIEVQPELIQETVETKPEKPKRVKRFGTIRFCSTHGKELPPNRVCSDCAEVVKKTETKDPLNNDMDQDGRHGDHFDKRINENKFLGDENWKSCPSLIKKGYFCHRCEFVLWHRLIWCPRCGGAFDFQKMSYKDMCETYPNYIIGY